MIYLDNAATSFPKPSSVVEAVNAYLTHIGGSPARSAHSLSIESGRILYEARVGLAELLEQKSEERIIFGANATFMLNSALYGLLKKGDRVLTTTLEHNSVLRPLENLRQKYGITLEFIQCSQTCELDLHDIESKLKGARAFICVYANNVSGAVLPIEEIYKLCMKHKVIFILDASQAVGSLPLKATNADIICASCHKGLYAPSALGFMSLNPHFDEELLESFIQGGSGSLSEEIVQPCMLPDKYESGTPNMCAIAGLRAGLEWIKEQGMEQIYAHKMKLRQYLYEGLKSIEGIKVYEIESKQCVGNLAFNIEGMYPSEVGLRLDREFGILTRVGLHCSPLTHKSIGSFACGGSIRLSVGAFNTTQEIERTLEAIKNIAKT
ncbi:aminotransferase class V-fold PLP-dependent enzyme [Helicobacter sp. MIT 21-1697]|uniref:aminotransferase class V-fold PLP-dependent enzyme n=1 Tax=Helicobacter sp. MIT 21-1697 TaxID=2993733 RepID=UPI00224B2BAF|nr:aminotransferase class V-fold PLP-dependent enzyme [Helicobacter sp. MIT 21-1697]MCX2716763.1 aminotransferase class V-fold PLP-dependent enzyme [Helicobacter sp. MIT 21-1697]